MSCPNPSWLCVSFNSRGTFTLPPRFPLYPSSIYSVAKDSSFSEQEDPLQCGTRLLSSFIVKVKRLPNQSQDSSNGWKPPWAPWGTRVEMTSTDEKKRYPLLFVSGILESNEWRNRVKDWIFNFLFSQNHTCKGGQITSYKWFAASLTAVTRGLILL